MLFPWHSLPRRRLSGMHCVQMNPNSGGPSPHANAPKAITPTSDIMSLVAHPWPSQVTHGAYQGLNTLPRLLLFGTEGFPDQVKRAGLMPKNARLQGFLNAAAPGSQLYVSYAGHAQYAQLCAGFGVCNIAGNIVCGANYTVTDRQVQVRLFAPPLQFSHVVNLTSCSNGCVP